MSLVGQATAEAPRMGGDEGEAFLRLLEEVLLANRLKPGSLVALRVGLPSGEPDREALLRAGVGGIPVFWERRPRPRVEIHVRLKRRRRLRSLVPEDP